MFRQELGPFVDRTRIALPRLGAGAPLGPHRRIVAVGNRSASQCSWKPVRRYRGDGDEKKVKITSGHRRNATRRHATTKRACRLTFSGQSRQPRRRTRCRQAEGQRHPPARAATEDHRPMLTRRMRSPLRRGSEPGHPVCLRELRLTSETLVSRLFRDAASRHWRLRHGMAAAHEICPSNPSDFAMSR
jgi:hypothetical protein